MPKRYLDDFAVGETFTAAPFTLEADEIIAFARRYDPQPFHIDHDQAARTHFGGLIASGFQTIAAGFAQWVRLGWFDGVSMGGPAMDRVRWIAPVHPGDTLHTFVRVLVVRPSRSKPDRGVLGLAFSIRNQAEQTVATFEATAIIARRPKP